MLVQIDTNGRRFVEVAVTLAGEPHEVWKAVASPAGLSSWFVPATFEEQDGVPVAVTLDFGGGMVSRSLVTRWDAPHTFAREGKGWMPGSPALGTEFHVRALGGGTTEFRVVQCLDADTDAWDTMLTAAAGGWPEYFRKLASRFSRDSTPEPR